MSLGSETDFNKYIGSGALNTYDYTFRIDNDADLLVIIMDTAFVETELVLGPGYTVNGEGEEGGGEVVLAVNLPLNNTLTIRRVIPVVQNTDIRNQGEFFPEIHEDALDRIVMIAQMLNFRLKRAIRLPDSVNPDDFDPTLPANIVGILNAGKLLAVNLTGDGIDMFDPADLINVAGALAIVNNLSDLDDPVEALFNLNIAPYSYPVVHALLSGQAATNLATETFDGLTYTSVEFSYEIKQGTTIVNTGSFSLFYINGTWTLVDGHNRDNGVVHGVTFSITQATTIAQLRAADSGAGNGTIKIKKHYFFA